MLRKNITLIITLCLIGCSSSKQRVIPQQVESDDAKLFNYAINDLIFDFGGGFKHDSAKLYIDGKLILKEELTTEPSQGYADGITIKKFLESIEVEIMINESRYTASLNLSLGHFFLISYYDDQIKIQQSKIPFYYD